MIADALQGPLAPAVQNGEIKAFAACPGEGGKTAICWIDNESMQADQPVEADPGPGALDPEQRWAMRAKAKRPELAMLNFAVVADTGLRWRSSIKVDEPWPRPVRDFPGALGYSQGSWELLVRLPDGLALIPFDENGLQAAKPLLSNAEAPSGWSSQSWLFSDANGWHVFWSMYYWPRYGLPDFMGGREQQRIEFLPANGGDHLVAKRVHEVQPSRIAPAEGFCITKTAGRYDGFYVQHSKPPNEDDPNCDLFYARDLLRGRRPAAKIAAGYYMSEPVTVDTADGRLHVMWLDERDSRPPSAPLEQPGGIYHELREIQLADGTWSQPTTVSEATDWSSGSLTAVASEGRSSMLAVGHPRNESHLQCLRGREGRWTLEGQVDLRPALRSGEELWVNRTFLTHCAASRYCLIVLVNNRLYWCMLKAGSKRDATN